MDCSVTTLTVLTKLSALYPNRDKRVEIFVVFKKCYDLTVPFCAESFGFVRVSNLTRILFLLCVVLG
jgi:hypothetical protein